MITGILYFSSNICFNGIPLKEGILLISEIIPFSVSIIPGLPIPIALISLSINLSII